MKKYVIIVLLLAALTAYSTFLSGQAVESFPLQAVRLLDSPFKNAMEKDRDYLLELDPDRLLVPYQIEAGLPPIAPGYANWEGSGLGGHIGGHYLSALAMLYAATGDSIILGRLHYMIDGLAACQAQSPDGYVGGVPDGRKMWEEVARGDIRAENFSLNERWVPWYNIHKVFAGLRDAYTYAGVTKAKEMLIKLCDWTIQLVAKLSDEQIQAMLQSEHGGMNEIFADVAEMTGEEKYLKLAHQFSHHLILDPLLQLNDALNGLHANTQIPKVIGFERVGVVGDNREWQDAAAFFWGTVVDNRTVAIGGNSVREHFHPEDDFSSMINSVEGPETCNTYNMLRLAKLLYERTGVLEYIEYYEQALYNHILSSQHPEHGGFVYFTPMRPQHYRVYSQSQKCFWCCVGSGLENHTKYGELIYAHKADELFVNLFIPSTLHWKEKGIRLTQRTKFPDEEEVSLEFEMEQARTFTLHIRYPEWVAEGELEVRVNGEKIAAEVMHGEYLAISRKWKLKDKVALKLPMQTHLERMPDGSDYYAVMHGPIVLAAKTGSQYLEGLIADGSRMGHIAAGSRIPLQEAPLFLGEVEEVVPKIKRKQGADLRFVSENLIYPDSFKDVELIPFFRLHDARYMLYWEVTDKEGLEERQQKLAMEEAERLALEKRTIDQVAPGEQQPETEHNFKGENTESGVHLNRHWRHAAGWFSYDLSDKKQEAKTLQITYFGLDSGRTFDILLNGQKLATVTSKGEHGPDFFTVDYPITDHFKPKSEGVWEVKFKAHEGSVAGGIYGVRLLR